MTTCLVECGTTCRWPGCSGILYPHSEQRVVVDSKFSFPPKGQPIQPYPKRVTRVFRRCDACESIFYHFHDLPIIPVYDDGELVAYRYPDEGRT